MSGDRVSGAKAQAWDDDAPPHLEYDSALAHSALTWRLEPDELSTAVSITRDARRLLGGTAAAIVVVTSGGNLEFRTCSGHEWMLLAALPRTLPLELTTDAQARRTAGGGRWPISATTDDHAGAGSLLCAPLGAGKIVFGTLLVLSTAHDPLTPRSTRQLTTLAIHASLALSAAHSTHHLRTALESRDVIGQAKGILMQTTQVTPELAYAQLQRTSQHLNMKLRRVADILCRTGRLPTAGEHR